MSKTTQELQKLSRADLTSKLTELPKELTEQKRARAAGELMNVHAIKKTRRAIATALTLLAQPSEEPKKEEAK